MPDANEPRIGLCLSGGGFRATLFHLGVTRYLYERGLLRNVTHITSVSGGSILAAHLVLHWERYNGSPSEFDAAVAELAGIFRHDLRGRVVCPWLFSCVTYPFTRLWCPRWWWRTRRLQAGYDLLYRGARMADLDQPGRPKLSILATSMTSGDMACFAGRKFLVVRNPDLDGSNGARIFPEVTPAGDVPVALAVAASSAFPPLFPPVVVGEETFGGADFPTPCHLADGGVFDNLGIRRLAWMARPDGGLELDMLVVSDAQRAFETEVQSEYNFLWTRAARSTDLMMNRLSFGEKRAAAHLAKERGWRLRDCELLRHVDSAKPYALSD
ncbi:MAG TPA: patatin-like phospholipase family protein, partial [Gemmataceae bacterium]